MATLREMEATQFRVFQRFSPDNQAKMVGIVRYVQQLSAMTSLPLTGLDFKAVFGEGAGEGLILDKTEINKRFFAYRATRIAAVPPELVKIEDDILKFIDAEMTAYGNNEARRLNQNRNTNLNDAHEFLQRAYSRLATAHQNWIRLQGVRPVDIRISDQLVKINQAGFWDFLGFTGESFGFVTKNPVVVSYKDPSQGIDITVDFGKFYGLYSIMDGAMRCRPASDFLSVDNYTHPHVHHSGDLCWGSASSAALSAIRTHDFVALFDLLAGLLSSYSEEAPYVSINSFSLAVNRGSRLKGDSTRFHEYKEKIVEYNAKKRGKPVHLGDPSGFIKNCKCSACVAYFEKPFVTPPQEAGESPFTGVTTATAAITGTFSGDLESIRQANRVPIVVSPDFSMTQARADFDEMREAIRANERPTGPMTSAGRPRNPIPSPTPAGEMDEYENLEF